MAGHLGARQVTEENLYVARTDEVRGLIMVMGAVPGSKGGYVRVRDAEKRALPINAPYPARTAGLEADLDDAGGKKDEKDAAVESGGGATADADEGVKA